MPKGWQFLLRAAPAGTTLPAVAEMDITVRTPIVTRAQHSAPQQRLLIARPGRRPAGSGDVTAMWTMQTAMRSGLLISKACQEDVGTPPILQDTLRAGLHRTICSMEQMVAAMMRLC